MYALRHAEAQILQKRPPCSGEERGADILSADGAVFSSTAMEHSKCQFILSEEAEVRL